MLMQTNIVVTTSLPVPLETESRNDPTYRVPPAPRSGTERHSGDVEMTEPASMADLWDKYHQAREIYMRACVSAQRTALPEGASHG